MAASVARMSEATSGLLLKHPHIASLMRATRYLKKSPALGRAFFRSGALMAGACGRSAANAGSDVRGAATHVRHRGCCARAAHLLRVRVHRWATNATYRCLTRIRLRETL